MLHPRGAWGFTSAVVQSFNLSPNGLNMNLNLSNFLLSQNEIHFLFALAETASRCIAFLSHLYADCPSSFGHYHRMCAMLLLKEKKLNSYLLFPQCR